jgi:hypothetical protein
MAFKPFFGLFGRKKKREPEPPPNPLQGYTGVSNAFGSYQPSVGANGTIQYTLNSPIATSANQTGMNNMEAARGLSQNLSGVFNGTNKAFNDYKGVFDTQTKQMKGQLEAKFANQNNNALGLARRDASAREVADYSAQQPYNFLNNVLTPTQNNLIGVANNAVATGSNAQSGVLQAFQQASGDNVAQRALQFQQQQLQQQQQENARNRRINLLTSGLSLAGTLAGAYFGGPAGAAVGNTVASSVGKSITGTKPTI